VIGVCMTFSGYREVSFLYLKMPGLISGHPADFYSLLRVVEHDTQFTFHYVIERLLRHISLNDIQNPYIHHRIEKGPLHAVRFTVQIPHSLQNHYHAARRDLEELRNVLFGSYER